MTTKNLYKGFSSHQFEYDKSFVVTDVNCVKRDLMNHIFTRLGERLKMTQFGNLIPDMVSEPLDQDTVDTIRNEINTVITFDPRIELVDFITVTPDYDTGSVTVSATLYYIELELQDRFDLALQFDN